MSIELKLLEENELRNIKLNIDDIDKNLIFNPISTYSITIDKKIIGLITFFDWYPNHVAISIIVDKRYRGKGIAGIALEKVIDLHGRNNTSINRFLYNVSQKNKSSIRVMEKLNW